MKKKGGVSALKIIDEWDPNLKESWLLEFERQPVNDERWTCIVTSAIPAKVEDGKCIQIYKKFVDLGLRRAVKVISMSDVVNLFKESGDQSDRKKGDKKIKGEKPEKSQKKEEKPSSPRLTQIMNLVLEYVTFNEFECKLPPGLMAVLLKYMILKLKEENIQKKKIDAVRQRKIRERNLKAKFIRDLKPFETSGREKPTSEEQENDEPFGGPDLYIMLTDFFDVFYYPELQKINIPFVAFLEISYVENTKEKCQTTSSIIAKPDLDASRGAAIEEFWKSLKENCDALETAHRFKDIMIMKYSATHFYNSANRKQDNEKIIFDEMSWVQYAAYFIYRQHQQYLQELYVQKVTLSLETLDLSKCEVYNKLCDALITGQPLTPLFILYSMIEQLVAGVPETESAETQFDSKITDFFSCRSGSNTYESSSSKNMTVNLVTPCVQCRNKANKYLSACSTYFADGQSNEKTERSNFPEDKEIKESKNVSTASFTRSDSSQSDKSDCSGESSGVFATLIDQVLSERKTEREVRKEKKWRTPSLLFYGDSISFQTYHCDPRIIDPQELMQRFMKNADTLKIWTKYPELTPEEKAFYSFHFNSLLRISQEKEDLFKIKIIFALLMKIAGESKFSLIPSHEEKLSQKELDVVDANEESSFRVHSVHLSGNSESQNAFSNYFYSNFILSLKKKKKHSPKMAGLEILATDNRSPVISRPINFMHLESLGESNSFGIIRNLLLPVLECHDIFGLSDFGFAKQFQGFSRMVEGFSFYENLKPGLMIQRLVENREDFNTIHCTYFPPTDNMAIILHNDSDYRGTFFRVKSGSLPTPVALRDFYSHVYREIGDWIVDEMAESAKQVSKLIEKEKAEKEKEDERFLEKLKQCFCRLNEDGRNEFLEQEIDETSEPEVTENELCDLPYKIKINGGDPSRNSFVVTNLGSLRVETCQKIHEFHSKDGTEVRVVLDCWLYDPSELLILTIRRFSLWFCCYSSLNNEKTNSTFTLKTASGIIFVFFREPETLAEAYTLFNVRISWPTGLLIEVKSTSNSLDSNRYVKQSYIRTYRKGWDIEDEKSRCYVKNGSIVIFKEAGEIEILTANGTVYKLYYGEPSRCETITMTGEVWEQKVGKTRCQKKRRIATHKIYIGVDCKTQETYYKRDDGTSCMLWPNGKLVTNYSDGTKITSIPDFDEDGVKMEWSGEEKEYFLKLEEDSENEPEEKSQTTMRSKNVSAQRCAQSDEFVSVSVTYLMEHPKYSTVFCENNSSLIEIKMLEDLKLRTPSEGYYTVEKGNIYLTVNNGVVQFSTQCDGCEKSSIAVVDFDSNILCRCLDIFENEYIVHKDGEIVFRKNTVDLEDITEGDDITEMKSVDSFCTKEHAVNTSWKQKCFLLERDFSGVEFIHQDCIARYCYDLPDESYYDLKTDDPNSDSHTFSSSLTKVGYESWVMHYEKEDSLPTNLKKKDLKDLEVKEKRSNLYKYPFPQGHDVGKCYNNQPRQKIKIPKIKLVRTVRYFSDPQQVINDICRYTMQYRKRALDLCSEYEKNGVAENLFNDASQVKMRLNKIAITLSQSLTLYPHTCTQLPSTEKDIHHFGHLINRMEGLKSHFNDECDSLPQCKQIPQRLPRLQHFRTIYEEN